MDLLIRSILNSNNNNNNNNNNDNNDKKRHVCGFFCPAVDTAYCRYLRGLVAIKMAR